MLVPGGRDAMLERMRQIMLVDPVPMLKTIISPTLLLWGDKDAMIPVTNAKDYMKAMVNSRLVTLPDLGHVPHEEAPLIALQPLLDFLR
jgi:pimeloyl-ACP methyl ester carboxylesterase